MSFFDRFSSLWASKGTASPPSDTQSDQGFSYLGQIPPSVELFNGMFQERDWKIKWLYQQISSVIGLDGSQPSETETSKAGGVLKNWFLPIRNPTIQGTTSMLGSLELGSQSVSSAAYIDFHTDGTNTDYNARIIAYNGTAGQSGPADLSVTAKSFYVPAISSIAENSAKAATTAFVQSLVGSKQPGGLTRMKVFQSTSYFTVPTGVTRMKARVWGGGGGGGNSAADNDAGAGGGGSGYDEGYFDVVAGDALQLNVGAGGMGGTSQTWWGGAGGQSSIYKNNSRICAVDGGDGGQGSNGNGIVTSGGSNGYIPAGLPDDLHVPGQKGGIAIVLSTSGSRVGFLKARGGSSFWAGWDSPLGYAGSASEGKGAEGVYPGGGAGGSVHANNAGSKGADGLIILEY